jgi:hypothetical protein
MTYTDSSEPPSRLAQDEDSFDTGSDQDPSEQWFFQFQHHLLLTVQAINRVRQALVDKMP